MQDLSIEKGRYVLKDYGQYKRLIKFFSSFIIVAVQVLIYYYVWMYYNTEVVRYPFFRKGNWLMAALYGVLLMFFLRMYGGFKISYLKKGNLIYSQILSVVIVNVITYLQIALLDKKFQNPVVFLAMTAADIVVIVIWAYVFQYVYSRLFPKKRMLFVYGERPAFHLMDKINSREDKYELAGAISYTCGIEKIMKMMKDYDAMIIGDMPAHERNLLMKRCFGEGIRTYTVPKISDILLRSSAELNVFDSPLYLSRNDGLQIEQRIIKRFVDIVFSAVGLVISSPLFLIFAAAIKITDGGPVFYKQERLTQGGQHFWIYKFRTMIQDAEKKSGPRLAGEKDDRILPVGHILRRTRLDELPQLINILKGEMSLVGPRPERPELAEEITKEIPEFTYRLKVKAGLTGYAQIYGKYNTEAYDKLKLDLTYIRNYSLLLDIRLMLMTPKIMLMKESTEGVSEADMDLAREASRWQEMKASRDKKDVTDTKQTRQGRGNDKNTDSGSACL